MIRILHIIGKMDRAGAETMLMNLYRNIDRSKMQFDFVTFTTDKGDYDDEIISMGGKIIPIIASGNIKRMFALRKYLKQHPEYQIMHSHMLLNIIFNFIAAKMAGVKNRIAHSHTTENRRYGLVANTYEKIAKNQINKLSTSKMSCGIEAASFLFPNQEDVWVFPNGVEVEKLANLQENTANSIFNKKENDIVVLQVGRLSEVKNPFFTLKVAETIKEKKLPIKIYFAGQGDLREKMEKQISDKQLQDVVSLLGIRSDVHQLMAEADVLIMPSFHEGFPVVLVESQSVGIPALVSTGVSSEVDLGVDLIDFLSIDDNPLEWVTSILKIKEKKRLDKEDRVQKLQQAGFDVVYTAKELENKYIELANEH